jgi:DNA-binding transcriptional regulator YiaG
LDVNAEASMPNLAAVLKHEIRRLARREARALVAPLRASLVRERRAVLALRAQLASNADQLGRLRAILKGMGEASPRVSAEDVKKRRWRKDTVRAIRNSLGLSQADFAKLVGVSVNAVYQWESAQTSPREKHRAVMLGLRGLGKRDARRLLAAR